MLRKSRFTLTDLVCIVLLGILSLTAVLPARSRMEEQQNRVRCASNMKMIGLAIAMYSNNETRNGNAFPRTHFKYGEADHPRFFTAWKQPHSFGEGGPEGCDVTASFYLLVKTQNLDPKSLVCPDSGKKTLAFGDQVPKPADPIADSRGSISNFPGIEYMSYSIENMFPSNDALAAGWKWNAAISPDYVVLADLNPGGKAVVSVKADSPAAQMREANSPNHGRDGQNVLYGDFHVEFQATPFCGAYPWEGPKIGDNIYCRKAGSAGDPIYGPPMASNDTVLLPTADYKQQEK